MIICKNKILLPMLSNRDDLRIKKLKYNSNCDRPQFFGWDLWLYHYKPLGNKS